MENFYDRETLWGFNMADLKQITIVNGIPKNPLRRDKRNYIDDILKFQGNYEEEKQKLDDVNKNKTAIKKVRIDNLLLIQDDKLLKKLKISELIDMLYALRVDRDKIDIICKLKGRSKKNALIDLLIVSNNIKPNINLKSKAPTPTESDKYKKYYVYPSHWFRDEYELIETKNGYEFTGLSNVQCALCYKKTGIFRKQFNVCKRVSFNFTIGIL